MTDNLPDKRKDTELAVGSEVFSGYLQKFGLPTDNIIASTDERNVIADNLPRLISSLPPEERESARYLSKFIGATAIGLFDAALNYIWNEVVLSLRKKVVLYGIDLFYDSAVGGRNRDSYHEESDLEGIKDNVLLDTCRKLELISDIVYRKLDHILTMRNEVAASHPNVESIGGYELLGWLQTCVKDVLQDKPSESAIRIKLLVANIKARKEVIDDPTYAKIFEELKKLALPHVNNLLITLFGIFVAPSTEQVLRANIAKISPAVWDCANDDVKYKIGVLIDSYRTNLEQEKLVKGVEFLSLVNGRMYETLSTKIISLEILCDRLDEVHENWDNYYNEPPVMKEILQFFRNSTDIPKEIRSKLIRVILRCRLGRGLSYQKGVSPGAKPLYDKFFSMLDDSGIIDFVIALFQPVINSKLVNPICQEHLSALLQLLHSIALSDRLKQVLDYLLADIPRAYNAYLIPEFKHLSAPMIKWG